MNVGASELSPAAAEKERCRKICLFGSSHGAREYANYLALDTDIMADEAIALIEAKLVLPSIGGSTGRRRRAGEVRETIW